MTALPGLPSRTRLLNRSRLHSRGLPPVELFIVIALLIRILLLVLDSARARSQRVECMANLREPNLRELGNVLQPDLNDRAGLVLRPNSQPWKTLAVAANKLIAPSILWQLFAARGLPPILDPARPRPRLGRQTRVVKSVATSSQEE